MDNEKMFGWVLVTAAILVLAVTSRLDLLAILVPGAALMGLAVVSLGSRKTGLTGSGKKG